MYSFYFGFREKPFTVTPDSRFFYTNPVYQEAYATLLCGIRERKGFVVLTGEVGTGKTTLLRRLIDNLEGTVRFVFFYNTNLNFDELVTFTCNELALPVEGKGRLPKIRALNDFLIDQLKRGGTAALLIDEAQNLSQHVLENLRLLSNLETGTEKLLQILLVGQPELETLLDQPKMRQLKQRVTLNYRLRRLERREVRSYIDYRLRAVGCERKDLFTSDGLELIVSYSKGIPRLINVICDNALQAAYAASRKRVSSDVIREVIRDLSLEPDAGVTARSMRPLRSEFGRKNWLAAGTLVVFLFVGAGGAVIYPQQMENYLSSAGAKFHQIIAVAGENFSSINRNLNAWFADLVPPEAEPKPAQALGRSAVSAEIGADSITESLAAANREPRIFSEETESSVSSVIYEQEQSVEPKSSPVPEATAVMKNKMETTRVHDGSAMGSVAYHFYGANTLLGLDLIMESNPQLQGLNGVSYTSGLRFPSLTKETLQRRKPDGSYHLILASFPSLTLAQGFARAVRLQGYEVMITPRRLAADLSLHRVEIAGLKTLEAANHAWETSLENRWLCFSDC
ncbi:MAG: AAA family ATPase [Candidatus Binatia bacterium]